MTSVISDVLVLSEDGYLAIFMKLVAVPTKVLLVGRAMAAEVDRMSAAKVAVSAMGVFKNFGSVITSRGGDVLK